jgi:aspartyl-tRNA(Asn)/glutamyl-tRNA(Gln) amidotransferase subunit C
MATPAEVQKLASLARITVPEADLPAFAKEFDSILEYVSQLNSLTVEKQKPLLPYVNVMREDGEPHAKGAYTEKLVKQFPKSDGTYLEVKKILSHD